MAAVVLKNICQLVISYCSAMFSKFQLWSHANDYHIALHYAKVQWKSYLLDMFNKTKINMFV